MRATVILLAILGLMLSSSLAQTGQELLNYQGLVTTSTGLPLGATGTPEAPVAAPINRKILFRIYDTATAGAKLWAEEQTVTISKGEFSVLLGLGIDATYNSISEASLHVPLSTVFGSGGTDRYIGITVDNADGVFNTSDVEITPRQRITTTAYALRAKTADSIAAGTDLQLNGSGNYGLGYYGGARLFNGTAVDGPVLYGNAGGALGSFNGTTQNTALRWNAAGQVGIGSATLTGASANTKLILQGDDANTAPLQLNIRGDTDTNKRLLIGYNTTGSYGSLQAYSAASTQTNLMLNPTGGNVGIGATTPPTASLDVSGGIKASAATGYTFNTGDLDGGLFSPSDGIVTLKTNGTERLRVDGSGNVGIGKTPSTKLDVSGSATVSATLNLPQTTSSGVGVIYIGTTRIHAWPGPGAGTINNFFAGPNTGNFTMSGTSNTGIGSQALLSNTTGQFNTAMAYRSLINNTDGSNNCAYGADALLTNTSGSFNTAVGVAALRDCTIGGNVTDSNTAMGHAALASLTTSSTCTAVGSRALTSCTTGVANTAMGNNALPVTITGSYNTATGYKALENNTGSYNTAVGAASLQNNTSGSSHTAIGFGSGPVNVGLSNTTCIGYGAQADASNMIRLGDNNVTSFKCKVGLTVTSDRRQKENFVPMNGGAVLKKILGMELTSWNFIGQDKTKFRHYGPMAQDFYAAFGHDGVGAIGEDTTINSGDLSGVMLSAIQELARKLEARDAEVKKRDEKIAALEKRQAEAEAREQARDAKLIAIEKLLLSTDKAAARTVSLKQGTGAE